jgi:hypothetical protein
MQFRRAGGEKRKIPVVSFCNLSPGSPLIHVLKARWIDMVQAVETVSRKSMTRECLVNATAAIGLVGSGALMLLLWVSLVVWFLGQFSWVW